MSRSVERNRHIKNLEKVATEDIQNALKRSVAVHKAKQCLRDYLEKEEDLVLDGIEVDFECNVRLETRGRISRRKVFKSISRVQKMTIKDPSTWNLTEEDKKFLRSCNTSPN